MRLAACNLYTLPIGSKVACLWIFYDEQFLRMDEIKKKRVAPQMNANVR